MGAALIIAVKHKLISSN